KRASPWQRGSNENTNRLLRQYLAKSADLQQFTQDELDVIAAELNNRPRSRHAFRTPAEIYTQAHQTVMQWPFETATVKRTPATDTTPRIPRRPDRQKGRTVDGGGSLPASPRPVERVAPAESPDFAQQAVASS